MGHYSTIFDCISQKFEGPFISFKEWGTQLILPFCCHPPRHCRSPSNQSCTHSASLFRSDPIMLVIVYDAANVNNSVVIRGFLPYIRRGKGELIRLFVLNELRSHFHGKCQVPAPKKAPNMITSGECQIHKESQKSQTGQILLLLLLPAVVNVRFCKAD